MPTCFLYCHWRDLQQKYEMPDTHLQRTLSEHVLNEDKLNVLIAGVPVFSCFPIRCRKHGEVQKCHNRPAAQLSALWSNKRCSNVPSIGTFRGGGLVYPTMDDTPPPPPAAWAPWDWLIGPKNTFSHTNGIPLETNFKLMNECHIAQNGRPTPKQNSAARRHKTWPTGPLL